MDQLHPDVRNVLNARRRVRADGIEPVHHLPRHIDSVEPAPEEEATGGEERSTLSENETSRFRQFFRAARLGMGLRRQDYGSAET